MAIATNVVYMQMTEAIEHYEGWIDFWLGARDDTPLRPDWMASNDELRVKTVTQSIVRTSRGS